MIIIKMRRSTTNGQDDNENVHVEGDYSIGVSYWIFLL